MRRIGWIIASVAALGVASVAASQAVDDPLTRPIAADYAARWLAPQPPKRIYGNTYLVGFRKMNVVLIDSGAGLIMIDSALPQSVTAVEANIRALGFKLSDVKLILSTEPHYDHAGGLAALARDTGATVVASAPAAAVLRAGKSGADDPQFGQLPALPAVTGKLRVVRDGEAIRLGSVTVTALATPGHTAGSMSWRWQSCDGARCLNMVFASSLNPVSVDGYRFSDPAHAAYVAAFRRTIARVGATPCDVLFTAHPDNSGGDTKFAAFELQPKPNPFIDSGACRDLSARYTKILGERLASEAKPKG
ncbi:MAG: subclass B3 metallo-beta-lactamase [Sphingomonas sp.]|uniref:subclass B3 metallo-beta-lactamase n=1 Tax=Sphingomonas sp. TaxID=28214 RepID=UPI0025CD9125|nr:subclass B3 metallo-beta-lactamase [Sphingomonas sp.]MBY0284378.1 subclass B3 metallo-beta-lactamase [Sphingomonas sp.]